MYKKHGLWTNNKYFLKLKNISLAHLHLGRSISSQQSMGYINKSKLLIIPVYLKLMHTVEPV